MTPKHPRADSQECDGSALEEVESDLAYLPLPYAASTRKLRTDTAKRQERNKMVNFSVAKMTFNQFCKDKDKALPWEQVLKDMSTMVAEAYVVANVHTILSVCSRSGHARSENHRDAGGSGIGQSVQGVAGDRGGLHQLTVHQPWLAAERKHTDGDQRLQPRPAQLLPAASEITEAPVRPQRVEVLHCAQAHFRGALQRRHVHEEQRDHPLLAGPQCEISGSNPQHAHEEDRVSGKVGGGDWSAKDIVRSIKKTVCVPVKRMEHELRRFTAVISIDEHRRSKVHHGCSRTVAHDLRKMHQKCQCKGGVKRTLRVHSVLHCNNNSGCGMAVNRDVNAPKNILEIVQYQLQGHKGRPPAFARTRRTQRMIQHDKPSVELNCSVIAGSDILRSRVGCRS